MISSLALLLLFSVQQEVKHLEAENEKLRAQIADLGNSVERWVHYQRFRM